MAVRTINAFTVGNVAQLTDAAKFAMANSAGATRTYTLAEVRTAIGTTSSATAYSVGPNGATNPAFQVDCSVGSLAAGLKVVGATSAGTVAIAVISSGSNANLSLDAKGTGTIVLGGTSTGAITLTRVTTMTNGFTSSAASTVNSAVSTTPQLTVTSGGVAFPTALISNAGTGFGVVSTTDSARGFVVAGENSEGNTARWVTAVSGGSVASPSATPSGAIIGSFEGRGYGTAWTTSGAAAMVLTATETWDGSGTGTKIDFYTTPNNSTTAGLRLTIAHDGVITATSSVSATHFTVSSGSGYVTARQAYLFDEANTDGGANSVVVGGRSQTTVGAAGGASALPATPTGYWKIAVDGTTRVVPFYAVS